MLTGAEVGEGIWMVGMDVLVGGMAVEVDVCVGMVVLVGTAVSVGGNVAEGGNVSVGRTGWNGVAVEVEFGLTVTN